MMAAAITAVPAENGGEALTAPWRSRIVGEGEVSPSELVAHPLNPRRHPQRQQDALSGVLSEVGWVQRVLVNRRTGRLVDGHARVELALRRGEASVPVLYVDLAPDEEAKILATLDPLATMASVDTETLDQLLREVSTGEAAVQVLLDEVAAKAGLLAPDDPLVEWQGMPAFAQDDLMPHRTLYVHFTDDAAVQDFARLLGQELSDKTKYLWYPPQARRAPGAMQFTSE